MCRIVDFSTVSPIGLQKSAVGQSVYDSLLFYTNITWTPQISQYGLNIFCYSNDGLIVPKNSQKTDWEVELAFVIGKKASYVEEADAPGPHCWVCLATTTTANARFRLERSGQWVKGKSCDTFAPLGPWIATADELVDIDDLNLWLKVDGEQRQSSNSTQLAFKIPHLVHYLSQFMTLLPGDVVSTGTPHGVGMGMNPSVYLHGGEVVTLGIDGLGEQRQEVTAYGA